MIEFIKIQLINQSKRPPISISSDSSSVSGFSSSCAASWFPPCAWAGPLPPLPPVTYKKLATSCPSKALAKSIGQ